MVLLERLKESVAWIGGTLAGLTALCYAAGYFSFHAHLTMLGLDGVVEFPYDQMLLEGAHFFFVTAQHLLVNGLSVGVAGLAIAATAAALARMGPIRRAWLVVEGFTKAHRRLLLVGLLLAFGGLVLWHTEKFYFPLQDVTSIDNQLFRPLPSQTALKRCPTASDSPASRLDTISLLLRNGPACEERLKGEFASVLNGFLVLLFLLGASLSKRYGTSFPTAASLTRVVLVSYALVYFLLLPVGFGILLRAPIHPFVDVVLRSGPSTGGFLLSRNDQGLLLWRPTERAAVWYPADSFGSLRVLGQKSLFPVEGEDKK